jgi:hypothetical protein
MADRQVGGVMRRDEIEVDVGEGLQQGARAEPRGRGWRVGIAGQDLVADDVARGVADGLADTDDSTPTLVAMGDQTLCTHPRNHRPKRPGTDPSAATLNAWAYSTVR